MVVVRYGILAPDDLPPHAITRKHAVNASVPKSWYERLTQSVQREGFRNPVLFNNLAGEMEVVYGESRCWVAHRLGIPVPAFVNDGTGRFEHFEQVTTEAQALAKFKDRPVKFRLGPPIFFFGCEP